MSLKIPPEKAMEKIETFIQETDKLLQKNYSESKEEYYELDTRIRTFINAAFDDAKQKINSYSGFSVVVVGREHTPEEKQEDYLGDLKRVKRHLVAWKEEIELNLEGIEKSDRLDKIRSKIEEQDLEPERRQKVAESKAWGAIIELLDFQRDLIKEKEQTTKAIIEIKKEVADIKEMIQQLSKED